MRLRCCLLLLAASWLASADSTDDYFAKAFKRAMPLPFSAPQINEGMKLYTFPFASNSTEPQILPQQKAFVVGPDECAIPLAQVPITKDRQFLIRKLPTGPSSKADRMATTAAIPVCSH